MPSNQHAIVIGVGPGLGAALVQKCVREGMTVSAGARDRDRLRTLLDERGLQDVPALRCDVTDAASVQGAFDDATADAGAPDLVVFNAGGYARGGILELSPGQLEAAWRVGCLGGFHVGQAGGESDGSGRTRHHPVHRRHRLPARQRQFRALRDRASSACAH